MTPERPPVMRVAFFVSGKKVQKAKKNKMPIFSKGVNVNFAKKIDEILETGVLTK